MKNSLSDYVVSDEDLIEFCSNLKKSFNVDILNYKLNFLNRRIAIRMYSLHCKTIQQYYSLIVENNSELTNLVQSLSINVTEFFRDKQVFDFFQTDILQKLKRQKKFPNLRILSFGCATGEEVYSIAISIFKNLLIDSGYDFSVTGVDVSKAAIDFAKAGIYEKTSLKNVIASDLQSFFKQNDILFTINDSVRAKTTFYNSDIFDFSSPIKFDCIFCRNLLIYLDRKTQITIFEKIYDHLSPDGFLIIGTAETITGYASKLFEPYDVTHRIFVKA